MIDMIIKMSLVTALYVALTAGLWLVLRRNKNRMRIRERVFVGVVYGICAILSTHFGVDYESMVLNVRDIAPLAAGLFFDPISGIIAGLVGGIERYIAGEYFGVGAYTRIACSVSTCLAGFLAAGLNVKIFKGKKPSPFYAFFMGAVMEVFHMYVVFITHRNDMTRAFYVVDTCSIPMIVFTGIGMAASAAVLLLLAGEVKFGLRKPNEEELPISVRFQAWLFIYTMIMLVATFSFSFSVQSRTVLQNAQNTMEINTNDAKQEYIYVKENNKIVNEILQDSGYKDPEITEKLNRLKNIGKNLENRRIGENGKIYIADSRGIVIIGEETGKTLIELGLNETQMNTENGFFMTNILDEESYCRIEKIYDGAIFLTVLPAVEVYSSRNSAAYETAFADILLFAVVFVLIYILVQKIVVNNLDRINASLARITQGQLDEVVDVKSSSEFASLSNDINLTVSALKGYIEQAEKRIEEELRFAKEIQSSALPKVFKFPKRNEFELYATMNPAKEVGGDFYDFFFIDNHQIAFVIADVSGKGIPA
ncbi:MAG: hypothetical protein IJ583_05825, partial [Firmicutes bacterium]|nr:hypothetical protein [Bacillota bacterium]